MICDVVTPDQCYTGGGGEDAEDGAVQAWQVPWQRHSAVSSHQPRHEATCSEDSKQEGGRVKLGAVQNDIQCDQVLTQWLICALTSLIMYYEEFTKCLKSLNKLWKQFKGFWT